MVLITKNRIILATLFIAVAFTAARVEASVNIDSLYQQAMEAIEADDYLLSDSLATLALAEIALLEGEDWTYSGERIPESAIFFGDYVMVQVQDKSAGRKVIEIYDPRKDELLRVHDMYPWKLGEQIYETANFIYISLERDGFLGYKLMCFRKGKAEPERYILRKGIEDHRITYVKRLLKNNLYFACIN